MTAALIGLTSSLTTILLFGFFKRIDKNTLYGLILAAIGFLYVGFAWTDITIVTINILQAVVFLLLAYYGIKKNANFLIAGYFLHGLWDFMYGWLASSALTPPDYDWFCLTYDFVVGAYLVWLQIKSTGHTQ